MIRKSYIKKLLHTYTRRLQKLREQEASYGISVEPKILLEIEDIEAKIEDLQKELDELEEFESFADNSTLLMPNQKINVFQDNYPEASCFIGRDIELRQLDNFLAKVTHGQPHLILINGNAGIGKSHLVREFIEQSKVTYPNLNSVIGYCNIFHKTNPFHPFKTILSQLSDSCDKKNLPVSIQMVVKNLKDVLMAPPASDENYVLNDIHSHKKFLLAEEIIHLRIMFFEEFSRLLFVLSQKEPLLLILEDLHWADDSTIDLLTYLSRDWGMQQLMILGTYRPEEIETSETEPPLAQARRELTQYGLCKHLKIGWFDQSNLQEWLDNAFPKNQFPQILSQWLYERTSGNALFVNEILKNLQEQQYIFQTEGEVWRLSPQLQNSNELPESISSVLDQRLARLEDRQRRLLNYASVEGEEFTAQVIANIRKVDDEELVNMLIETLDHQLELISLKEERQILHSYWLTVFEFQHCIMQRHLYNSLDVPYRRRLHRQIGECLVSLFGEKAHEIAPTLARHFSEGGDAEKTLQYALIAAEQAEKVYDYKSSREWLQLTIAHLPSLSLDSQTQAEIWCKFGQAEAMAGSFEKAEVCFRKALAFLKKVQPANQAQADILLGLGYCYIQTARSKKAITVITEALELHQESGRYNEVAYCMVYLAFAYHKSDREDLSREYLLQTYQMFDDIDDLAGKALTNRYLGMSYRIEGNFELSTKYLQDGIELDHQLGNKFTEASGYTNLGSTYLVLKNDQTKAMACYQKSLELSRQISKVHEEGHVLLNIGRLLAWQEEWQQALENVEEGLRISKAVQQTSNIIRGYCYRGIIQYHLGQLEDAIIDFDTALNIKDYDYRSRWGLLFNFGSLQLKAGKDSDALKYYLEASEIILNLSRELSDEQKIKFFEAEQKRYVLLASQKTAKRLGRQNEVETLFVEISSSLLLGADQSIPLFYWGGNKWT